MRTNKHIKRQPNVSDKMGSSPPSSEEDLVEAVIYEAFDFPREGEVEPAAASMSVTYPSDHPVVGNSRGLTLLSQYTELERNVEGLKVNVEGLKVSLNLCCCSDSKAHGF